MSSMTVRNIDEKLKTQLRIRAAENGRSMEAEVREILRSTLNAKEPASGLGSRIHERFRGLAGDKLELPTRDSLPRSADYSGA